MSEHFSSRTPADRSELRRRLLEIEAQLDQQDRLIHPPKQRHEDSWLERSPVVALKPKQRQDPARVFHAPLEEIHDQQDRQSEPRPSLDALLDELDRRDQGVDSETDPRWTRPYHQVMHRARAEGQHPAQKPVYKDKLGRATLRGWDEQLAAEDITDDEALEIELELRHTQEGERARKQAERQEVAAIQQYLERERTEDAWQERLESPDQLPPTKLAAQKYGGTGYDAGSVYQGRRETRADYLAGRAYRSIGPSNRGIHPPQKPFDRYRLNRLQEERLRNGDLD